MSDTNIFKVEQSRLNMDLVDEEWEKDYLSDDEMVILHEAEIVLDRNEEDDEEEEVNDDAWNDRGSDRLILEALAGDSTTHAQGGGATSSLPANNNINASSATSGPNNAQFTSVATQFLPHVPSH